ncbi:restriction endonuclease [Phenylobacterium sp.]|uniref:restriction endonuclease n=1 Tax=Phenylobacterium sp. TaxID=1871053 RepID=UPI0035AD9C90
MSDLGEAKLSDAEIAKVESGIAQLKSGVGDLSHQEAEHLLGEVLEPLLECEGYDVEHTGGVGDGGIDFVARSRDGATDEILGVEFRYFQREGARVGATDVRTLVGTALLRDLDRAVLVSNRVFSEQARALIEKRLPFRIDLLDLNGLSAWAERLKVEEPDVSAEITRILKDVSRRFAEMIARNPQALDNLEWRDVERVVAEIFDGLGFGAQLTPPAQDGGKDVVLTCEVNGLSAQYYIEVKHWRSKTKVGAAAVKDFIKVIAREKKAGGIFLSTYGYTANAFEELVEIDRKNVRFDGQDRVVTLCQTYVKAKAGIWSPPSDLSSLLFSDNEA